jgi:hypothetical protein
MSRWVIVFEALPEGPPPALRVRRLLKFAGRVLQLKAVEIREPDRLQQAKREQRER